MLWIKALHIFFVIAWFAGLFYLPRVLVNLALENAGDAAALPRLLTMARKLYRFMTLLAVGALGFGLWLWLAYFNSGIGGGWLHAKLVLVILLIGYHHACGRLVAKFEQGRNTHSHVWYRWFNEVPTVILLLVVMLTVVKPF